MRNSIGTIYPFGYIRLEYSASTHETMTHCFSEQKKLFFLKKKVWSYFDTRFQHSN